MAGLGPVSRRELVARFHRLGFEGPYGGGNHEFMVRGERRLTIPNTHGADIGVDLLSRVLKQADVTRGEWESAK